MGENIDSINSIIYSITRFNLKMEIQFKHMVLIYAILIFLLFLYKPQLFRLNIEDQNLRRRKFTTLVALFIVLAIITYYIKIFLSRESS